MHPQPVSDVNPSWLARLRSRTANDMAAVAFGSCDLWIGWKLERYVIHILDSKSSRNGVGHPPSSSLPPLSLEVVPWLPVCSCDGSAWLFVISSGSEVKSLLLAVLSEGEFGTAWLIMTGSTLVSVCGGGGVSYREPRQ
jgi:hypothetical protein